MLSSWVNVIDKIMRLMTAAMMAAAVTTIFQCRTHSKSHIFGFVCMQNHFAMERGRVSSSLTSLLSDHHSSHKDTHARHTHTLKNLIPMTKSNFISIQFTHFTPSVLIFSLSHSFPLFPVSLSIVVFQTDEGYTQKTHLLFAPPWQCVFVIRMYAWVGRWMGVFSCTHWNLMWCVETNKFVVFISKFT